MLDLSTLQTIISLLVLVITWLIVQPLRTAIDGLSKSLEELRAEIHKNHNSLNDLRVNVQSMTEANKSAHKRLDEYNDRLHEVEKTHHA